MAHLAYAAMLLDTSPKTLGLAAIAGEIEAPHALPHGPWIFNQNIWTKQQVKGSPRRQKTGNNNPQDHFSKKKTYSYQQHRKMGIMKQDCIGGANWYRPHSALKRKPPTSRLGLNENNLL